ncbi:uncharacterized membrane protein YidH (DUF202 family) [Streptosporangium becharense]|uniref:Uncharacterized membrane protein YidH (DUF202 family) n=1 Tax=Streptosporangium becharense TaxID=1816182 RepID=A0A7W9IJM1_9ACTN|nr:DUF4328 domain-containing protein [Streptosporangium becharense]MBB2910983.1 uncharacterized membrane protein YidH (DUF202 family) [Streptosporangium becharense]MBB5821959.1 uncharacterized membrane protein YidH (DUF202 family) [Streptosporangium becharense]
MRSIPSPQKKAASAVYLALTALVLALTALVVFERARGRRLVLEVSEMGGDPHAPGAQAVVGAVTVFAVLIILVAVTAVAAAVAYLNWLLRARRGAGLARTPALASWFAPAANLVLPAVLVDRLWLTARPPADRRPRWLALLTVWWLSWLTALVLVLVRLWPGAPHGGADLTGIGPAELSAVAVAALLCAATVREVTAVQAAGSRPRGGRAAAHVEPSPSPEPAPRSHPGARPSARLNARLSARLSAGRDARRGALRLLTARPFLRRTSGTTPPGAAEQTEQVSSTGR